ncbi:hypothetical protein [Bradyrhizobium sp. MOS002]|jgi:hypothetical protein|nr:hypothetical protein [Bradyrhizobium sp. MOS002]
MKIDAIDQTGRQRRNAARGFHAGEFAACIGAAMASPPRDGAAGAAR